MSKSVPVSFGLLAFLASFACTPAHHPGTSGASPKMPECPDSHAVCITPPECVFDEARQCNECRCSSPHQAPPEGGGVPPIQ